jgi:hypothetical protein
MGVRWAADQSLMLIASSSIPVPPRILPVSIIKRVMRYRPISILVVFLPAHELLSMAPTAFVARSARSNDLVAAVAASQHVPTGEVVPLLQREEKLRQAAVRVRRDLGTAQPEDVWIDRGARNLLVRVGDAKQMDVVRRDGGQPRLLAGGAPEADVVSGEAASALPVTRPLAASAPGVGTDLVMDGDEIMGPDQICSAGPWVRDQFNRDLQLTAGHCLKNSTRADTWRHAGNVIGKVDWAVSFPQDWGAISYNRDPHVSTPTVLINPGTKGGHVAPLIVGKMPKTELTLGMLVCKSGTTTGFTCGQFDWYGWEHGPLFDGLAYALYRDQMRVDGMCTRAGDSGATVFYPVIKDGELMAKVLGVHSQTVVNWEQPNALKAFARIPNTQTVETVYSNPSGECADRIPGHTDQDMIEFFTHIDDISAGYPGGLTLMDASNAPPGSAGPVVVVPSRASTLSRAGPSVVPGSPTGSA